MKRLLLPLFMVFIFVVISLTSCTLNDIFSDIITSDNKSSNNEKNSHTHTLSDWIVDKEATCKEEGLRYKECVECKKVLKTEEIQPLTIHNVENNMCIVCHCQESSPGLQYSLNADKTYSVIGVGSALDFSTSIVVGIYNNQSVSAISDRAFAGCESISKLTICDSVTEIGEFTFSGCTNLKNVEISNKVAKIGAGAFYFCKNLANIIIPNGITTICDNTFSNCWNLSRITIPNGVTHIGSNAFYDCERLTSVTIPNSITHIEKNAFFDSGLCSVHISDISSWCNIDFEDYSANPLCYASKLYLNDELVTDLIISDKTTTVSDFAFYGCLSVHNIIIPNTVEVIGNSAFAECENLESIKLPFIGANKEGTSSTSLGYIFGEPDPSGHSIHVPASLKKVILTNTSRIDSYAFYGCKNIESVVIPDSVTSIGASAFTDCKNLTDLIIPNSVLTIGNSAFSGNSNLVNVKIPSSVTTIGSDAFKDCTKIKNVYITDIAAWCKISFGNVRSTPLFYAENFYLNENILTEIIIPDDVLVISPYVFYHCTAITNVEIPNNVIEIGHTAFSNCANLEKVIIGSGVNTIGESAFSNCTKLTNVVIGENVLRVGNDAFSYCYELEYNEYENAYYLGNEHNPYLVLVKSTSENINYVNINKNTKFIHSSAFSRCENISNIEIPNGVISIGSSAFFSCGSFTDVVIPDSVTYVGGKAFYNCYNLKKIVIPESVIEIGSAALSYCPSLKEIKYRGTEETWNTIIKGENWDSSTDYYTITYNYDGD